MTKQEEIKNRHGTPEEFERAVWEVHAQLFVTTEEAMRAIIDYRDQWRTEESGKRTRGLAISALSLAIMFHETYERLALSYGYETRLETRNFDENSPNGRLMVATCEAILEEISKLI